jgi:predicted nucleic acid-binding protein
VVGRSEHRDRFSLERAEEVLAGLAAAAIGAADPDPVPRVSRDPDDDYIVALAAAEGCDALVTGDRDLLEAEALPVPVIRTGDLAARVASARI